MSAHTARRLGLLGVRGCRVRSLRDTFATRRQYTPWTPSKDDFDLLRVNQTKLKRKAKNGDAFAQYSYGAYCLMKKDMKQAAKWLEKAANAGHLDAEYSMGCLHLEGNGVERDDRKALEYLLRSANKGHTQALFVLGDVLMRGKGVPRDEKKGIGFILQAAVLGNPTAEFAIGSLHATGKGLVRDPVAARAWMDRAGARGHAKALEVSDKLGYAVERRKLWTRGIGSRLFYNLFMRLRGEPSLPFFGTDPLMSPNSARHPTRIDAEVEKISLKLREAVARAKKGGGGEKSVGFGQASSGIGGSQKLVFMKRNITGRNK
ncbi:hypothetical protein AAMO2058_001241400 [Amorphochlora amoebiformis]